MSRVPTTPRDGGAIHVGTWDPSTDPKESYTAADIAGTLHRFETRYRMSTASFMSKWRVGELDHGDFDLSQWALLASAYARAVEAEDR